MREDGQATAEYLLATVMILGVFLGLYAMLENGIPNLFIGAARIILTAYY